MTTPAADALSVERVDTPIPGCVELRPPVARDRRGSLAKPFQQTLFRELGLDLEIRELFHSRSHQGVLRGLHFQLPPSDVAKLVYCVAGRAFDAVVDLRAGSPTQGRHHALELSADSDNAVFVPRGCAHGFVALEEPTTVAYAYDGEFDPECDSGIRWDSAGIDWPVDEPILSDRDAGLVPMSSFDSPFTFETDGD